MPLAKPGSKALDNPAQSAESHRDTVLEVSQTVEQATTPTKDLICDTFNGSRQEKLQCASRDSNLDDRSSNQSHSLDDCEDGNVTSSPPFVGSVTVEW